MSIGLNVPSRTFHGFKKLCTWLEKRLEEYEEGNATVLDREYDRVVREVSSMVEKYPDLDSPSLPIHRVGALTERGTTKPHLSRMRSLKTLFTVSDALHFCADVDIMQPKVDGVSLNLVYRRIHGTSAFALVTALLRGDGSKGEVVRDVALVVDGVQESFAVPSHSRGLFANTALFLSAQTDLEIRGEVVWEKAKFAQVQAYQSRRGEEPYVSARNSIAGILRKKNAAALLAALPTRPVFVVWGLGYAPARNLGICLSHVLSLLSRAGFSVVPTRALGRDARFNIPWESDGVVFKVDTLSQQARCGEVDHHPLWAVAVKEESPSGTTRLAHVTWSVGRSGAITPVGVLRPPVVLAGASITNVNLHNIAEIHRLGLRKGSSVVVERRGGVIPKVTRLLHLGGGATITPPVRCPSCHVHSIQVGPTTLCLNRANCRKQIIRRIVFAARCFGIDGIASGQAESLFMHHLVLSPPDLFSLPLREAALRLLPGWGEASAANLIAQLNRSREIELAKFLEALSIVGMGTRMSTAFAAHYRSITRLVGATSNPLDAKKQRKVVENISRLAGYSKIARPIETAFEMLVCSEVQDELKMYLANAVVVKSWGRVRNSTPSRILLIAFTGALSAPRSHFQKLVASAGHRTTTGVSKNVDYFVVGESPTQRKVDKAQMLNTKIIDETELLRVLGVKHV